MSDAFLQPHVSSLLLLFCFWSHCHFICLYFLPVFIVGAILITKLVDPPSVNASLSLPLLLLIPHPKQEEREREREAPSRAHHEEVAGQIGAPKQKHVLKKVTKPLREWAREE